MLMAYTCIVMCLLLILCHALLVVVAVEEARIYRAGGWVEFNRVNGEQYVTVHCMFLCPCYIAWIEWQANCAGAMYVR